MTADVVSLCRTASGARDWSNQELAEFYRVENSLIRAGLSVETDRGLSDEGDPWFVFCHPETGDIIIHFARFDGSYAVASAAFDRCVRGDDLRSLAETLIAVHPLTKANSDTKISIHPAALMVVVVMTCFFKLAQTQAYASQLGSGEAQTGPAAGADHDAVVKSGSVMADGRHSQMLLAAIAFAITWADPGAGGSSLFTQPGAADVVQPMVFAPNSEKADAGLDSVDDSGLAFAHLGQPADHAPLVLGAVSFGDVAAAAAPIGDWGRFHTTLETLSIMTFDRVPFINAPMSSFSDTAKSADQGAGGPMWLPAIVNVVLVAKGAIGSASASAITNTPESPEGVNDQAAASTVNVGDNDQVGAQNLFVSTADPTNHVDIIVGDPLHTAGGTLGNVPLTGDEVVSITAKGGADTVGFVALTPALTGNEQITLAGDQALIVGTAAFGAIAELNPTTGLLNRSNLTLTVTDNAAVTLDGATGGVLSFITDAAAIPLAPTISYSTNAMMIDASGSGGALVMLGGDANFSAGATITGSARPGNVLGGSIGNDTIKSLSMSGGDAIYTNGGADTISLAAGHTGADHIDLYAGVGPVVGGAIPSVANAISEISGVSEMVNPGWWGIGASGASKAITAAAAAWYGTSSDQTTITNFVTGSAGAPQDVLDFSIRAWGSGGTDVGLATGGFGAATAGTLNVGNVQGVNPGDTVNSTTELIVLKTGTFADANAVALAFQTGSYDSLAHPLLAAGQIAHWLVEYQDPSSNVHIADVYLMGTGHTTVGLDVIRASDMVQLTGVNVAQLHPGNIHLVG